MLTCTEPGCDETYADARGLSSHMRAHGEKIPCPVCGKMLNPQGTGPHLRTHPEYQAQKQAEAAAAKEAKAAARAQARADKANAKVAERAARADARSQAAAEGQAEREEKARQKVADRQQAKIDRAVAAHERQMAKADAVAAEKAAKANAEAAIRGLLPGLDGDVALRLRSFVFAADDLYNAVVVIGVTYGPRLVGRRYIADIVVAAKEPLIVASIAQLRTFQAEAGDA